MIGKIFLRKWGFKDREILSMNICVEGAILGWLQWHEMRLSFMDWADFKIKVKKDIDHRKKEPHIKN